MNGRLSVAGRASHYGTQFWRPPSRSYPTRAALRRAHSVKALERRLVLPLEAHNWVRALEVLKARYARSGRTADHYQRVVRNMVESVSTPSAAAAAAAPGGVGDAVGAPAPTRHAQAVAGALDSIRDAAYAETIPVNRSLWVTLLWAYCALDEPQRALECFAQAERRFRLSAATLAHMAELLLPVLSRHGRHAEAKALVDTHLQPVSGSTAGGVGAVSATDARRRRRWIAEAAARAGDWRAALDTLTSSAEAAATPTASVESLFTAETAAPPAALCGEERGVREGGEGAFLSRGARRELLRSLATCDAAAVAAEPAITARLLECWEVLYPSEAPEVSTAAGPWPPTEDVQLLMNGLAAAGRWCDVLHVFAVYYMGHESARVYLKEEVETRVVGADPRPAPTARPLNDVALNLVFTCFPRHAAQVAKPAAAHSVDTAVGSPAPAPSSLSVVCVESPAVVVRLLDDLLLTRDDIVLTDHVMDAVGPALLQLGQPERCLQLLRHAPAFTTPTTAAAAAGHTPEARALRGRLANLVYAVHGATTTELRYAAVMAFPFLFPPEMLRGLPAPDKMGPYVASLLQAQEEEAAAALTKGKGQAIAAAAAPAAPVATAALSDDERYEAAVERRRRTAAAAVRPSRQHYVRTRSPVVLTEAQEAAMQRNHVALWRAREDAFAGRNADADPRPVPKGLHDTASGWNFFGRGGEMVFSNNTRIPHPLSMQPKVMRALANPYRSWNPRQSSSLAHKESVIKWNGKSSV